MDKREKRHTRKTKETDVNIYFNIDGSGNCNIDTGIGFFDHMLTSFITHGRFDADIKVKGDTFVDFHHSVEDTGIVLGKVFNDALLDKRGIKRFGSSFVPMDEALVLSSVDISGRPYLVFDCEFPSEKIGDMDTENFIEFFRAFAFNAGITLHIKLFSGANSHHIAEAIFKSTARALKEACTIDKSIDEVLSSKGVI